MTVSVDLGCGGGPRNDFGAEEAWGVDLVDVGNPMVRVADLCVEPIPFETSSVDYVLAYDFVEHVPRLLYVDGVRRNPFVELMNEVWRVLKPGGTFLAKTPAWPHHEADVDPTHVQTITEGTMAYFTEESHRHLARSYGFVGWFAGTQQWDPQVPYWLCWRLTAVK